MIKSKKLYTTFFLFLLTAALSINVKAQQKSSSKQPNIILIVADDLGYGDLGCYGQQKIETPNLDKMAKGGMKFTQFYAGTAVCAPSRAALMTGLHTGHTPISGNKGVKPEGQFPLPDTTVTIASVLQKRGYTTAAFGKWGLGFPGSTGEPLRQGFTTFFGYNCQTLAHNYYPDHLWNNNTRLELPGNLKSDSLYSADLIQQNALQFLKEQGNKPFFLFLPYTLPHASLYGPHDSIYNYYVQKFNEPEVSPTEGKKPEYKLESHPHAAYAAMVTRLDSYVGQLMKALEQKGIANNTLVLFTSDNGPHREGGGDPDFFNSSRDLKGIKRDLYEGGIRVPFIAVWKGKIKPGTVSNYNGTFWDLFPTFQQMAGGKAASQQIDGLSLLPALYSQPQKQHPYLYWEFHENNGRQAVRWGKWKGVKLNVSTNPDAKVELYDLEADPLEKKNVAEQHLDVVKHIESIIQEAHKSDKNWPLIYTEKNNEQSAKK